MLRIRHGVSRPVSKFFEDGRQIATFDGGPCDLIFADGKRFTYSRWGVGEVDDRIYPTGTAEMAIIVDLDLQVIDDEDLSDVTFVYHDGKIVHYKEGNVITVAHSETPRDSNHRAIVCNKRCYWVNYEKRIWSWVSTIDDGQDCIGTIIENRVVPYFSTRSSLPDYIPLKERVFITLLAFDWPDHELAAKK